VSEPADLPAWSLPAGAGERISIGVDWPEQVTRDWAFGEATGKGVRVGDIDSGIDLTHPDIVPNLDLADSCSFIFDHDPTALPVEKANGDCSNKAAVQDYSGHGTHTASTIAAPINGIGIAGVAPEATIVAIKACTTVGFCFADSVAACANPATRTSIIAGASSTGSRNVAVQRSPCQRLNTTTRLSG